MKIDKKYFEKEIIVTTKDGNKYRGLFNDTFDEWNEILVGNILIDRDDIKEVECVEKEKAEE